MNLVNTLEYCAGTLGGGIPEGIGNVVHLIVLAIQVVVPILLISTLPFNFGKRCSTKSATWRASS